MLLYNDRVLRIRLGWHVSISVRFLSANLWLFLCPTFPEHAPRPLDACHIYCVHIDWCTLARTRDPQARVPGACIHQSVHLQCTSITQVIMATVNKSYNMPFPPCRPILSLPVPFCISAVDHRNILGESPAIRYGKHERSASHYPIGVRHVAVPPARQVKHTQCHPCAHTATHFHEPPSTCTHHHQSYSSMPQLYPHTATRWGPHNNRRGNHVLVEQHSAH